MCAQECFCLSSVDTAVCKTKGQALTNPGFLANTLSSDSTFSLPLSLSHTQQLFCLQQRLPVPVWPQQHTTKVTSWRRNGKQGRGRRKERGSEQNTRHCPRAFLSLSARKLQNTHPEPHTIHTNAGRAREKEQVTDDQMKGDTVNLEVDQRGLPPPRIWLSKYQSSLPVSLWHTYSAED